MLSNKRKLILILLIILAVVLLGMAVYFIRKTSKDKIETSKSSEIGAPPYKTEEERQQCEKGFVMSDDKIKWAFETAVPKFTEGDSPLKGLLMLTYLTDYFSCKAAISGKYDDCNSNFDSKDKDLEKNNQLICHKTVWYKKVFLRLTKDKNISDSLVADFNEYILKYAPDSSNLKQGIKANKIKAEDFLTAIAQRNGDICQGPEKESCQAALTRDEKYCQGLTENKESCIAGAQFMRVLDSGDVRKCNGIQDKDEVLPQICHFVLNQDSEYCTSGDVIGKFIHQYCYFGHLQ